MSAAEYFGLLAAIYLAQTMNKGFALSIGLICVALQFAAHFLSK